MPSARRVLLACLVLPVGLLCCHDLEDRKQPGSARAPSPEQEAWDWSTVVTRSGRRRAAVVAGHLIKTDPTEAVTLDSGVTVFFYDTAGRDTVSRLESAGALIDESNSRLTALGSVVLLSRDSTRLLADTLVWNRESDLITGAGRVTIRRPDGEETGVGFEATSDLTRWSMHEVTSRFVRRDTLP